MEEEDSPPARKVVSRSPAKTVRVLNLSGIWDSPIECESSLERDFVYRLALCPGVVRLRHQPFRLRLPSGRVYTPDFLATHRDGSSSVVEVKPKAKVPGYRDVFDEVTARCAARGLTFTVLTDERIRANRAHERAALILRYRKTAPDQAGLDRIKAVLTASGGGVSIAALLDQAEASVEALYHLASLRQVVLSRDLHTTGAARVRLFNEWENHHAFRTEGWFGVSPWRAAVRGDPDPGRGRSAVPGRVDLPGPDGEAG